MEHLIKKIELLEKEITTLREQLASVGQRGYELAQKAIDAQCECRCVYDAETTPQTYDEALAAQKEVECKYKICNICGKEYLAGTMCGCTYGYVK